MNREQEEYPPYVVPDVVADIYNWRCFGIVENLTDGVLRLISSSHAHIWEPRVPCCAECKLIANLKTHVVPDENCQCGIYATSDPRQALHYINRGTSPINLNNWKEITTVVAKVQQWGRIIVGDVGARSEFAYPKWFSIGSRELEVGRKIADIYGIEMRTGPVHDLFYDLRDNPTMSEETTRLRFLALTDA